MTIEREIDSQLQMHYGMDCLPFYSLDRDRQIRWERPPIQRRYLVSLIGMRHMGEIILTHRLADSVPAESRFLCISKCCRQEVGRV